MARGSCCIPMAVDVEPPVKLPLHDAAEIAVLPAILIPLTRAANDIREDVFPVSLVRA